MSLKFNVSVTDTVGGYGGYASLIQTDMAYAGSVWAAFIDSDASIEVQVNIAPSAIQTADGTAATETFIGTENNDNFFLFNTIGEMLTGVDSNGSAADVIIKVDPQYINQHLYFDPSPSPTSFVPSDKVDAVEVFEHELGHAFGFNGFLDLQTGASQGSRSTYDAYVVTIGGVQYFTGPKAEAVYGGPVPLTQDNFDHVANSVASGLPGSDLLGDIMNGVIGFLGKGPGPSALDLAILTDVGVPMIVAQTQIVTLNDAAMFLTGQMDFIDTLTGPLNDGAQLTEFGQIEANGFTLTNIGFNLNGRQFDSSNAIWAQDFDESFDGPYLLHTIANATTENTDIRIQAQDGGAFTATSIDLDALHAGVVFGVTFNGLTASNAQVSQTFALDGLSGLQTFHFNSSFADLVSLEMTSSGRTVPFGQGSLLQASDVIFDNLVLAKNLTPTDSGRFGDLDGSGGMADVVWRNDDGSVAVWQMNGGSVTPHFLQGVSSDWHIAGTADFNADGKTDILWQNDSCALLDWQMASSAQIGSSFGIGTAPVGATLAGLGDVDHDGKADLFWRDSTTGAVTVNTIAGASHTTTGTGVDWQVVGVGDYNGDGVADIMFRNTSLGVNAAWLMNGVSRASTVFYPGVPNDWHVVGTGDFDSNGIADLFWHDDNGANAVWLLNNSGGIAQAAFFNGVAPDWHVAGTGDFNGDHKDDVIWRDDNGATAVWLMNGAAAPAVSFPGGVPTDWSTQAHHYEYV